jgi:1-acyl-sn-glycerol-3-phosphate acyltransferase
MGIVAYAIAARSPEDSFPLALLRALTLLYSRFFHRLRVEGTERDPLGMPEKPGCLVVAVPERGQVGGNPERDPEAPALGT